MSDCEKRGHIWDGRVGRDFSCERCGAPYSPPSRIPSLSDRERIFANEPYDPPCSIPPKGWRCTRKPGHEGPCAAIPETDRIDTQGTDSGLAEMVVLDEELDEQHPGWMDGQGPDDAWERHLCFKRLSMLDSERNDPNDTTPLSYKEIGFISEALARTDRKAVLEEAAQRAERYGARMQEAGGAPSDEDVYTAKAIAQAIRALAEGAGK